jgi:glycosyltransferase involved in cell wall biosynthesis
MFKLREALRGLGHTCDALFADDLGAAPRNAHLRQAIGPMTAFAAVRRWCEAHGTYDIVDVASAEGLWLGAMRRLGALRHTAIVARSHGLEHLNYRRMIQDHDEGLARKPWTRRWFHPAVRLTQVAAAARAADRLIVVNDEDREFAIARRWKTADAIDVVPHGVSAPCVANGSGRGLPRGRGVLFCGGWSPTKGVSYLGAAFSRLVARGLHPNLTVLGGAVAKESIQSAFSVEARRYVTIVERVPESAVITAYRTHDVLVLPSTYEGFGMVVPEAMTERLPVVATPVGAAKSLIVDGETGLLVPPRDADALADAIARLLTDPALRVKVADAAFELVRDMTWTRTAQRTIESYTRAQTRGRA